MYLVSNIIVKALVNSVGGWFVESFGIVGIPTLAFNPLHSWLSIDHHSLLQVALCQLEKFAPGQSQRHLKKEESGKALKLEDLP